MKPDDIKVEVHYMAAAKPFRSEESRTTTVGTIKSNALNAFGLVEDATKRYPLFLKKEELTNPSQTLGDLADEHHNLNLKLEEVLVQG